METSSSTKLKDFTPKSQFICYADVVGFENMIDLWGTKHIADSYGNIIIESIKRSVEFGYPKVKQGIFSDTILLWTEDDSYESFEEMCKFSSSLLLTGFFTFPMRGAIAHGDCIISPDDNMYVGKPLISAYHQAENMAWIGGRIVGGKYCPPLDHIDQCLSKGFLLKWKIPIKEKGDKIIYEDGYAIDISFSLGGLTQDMLDNCGIGAPEDKKIYWDAGKKFIKERLLSRERFIV